MWYLITAIISGAVGAFLMGLVAGAKLNEECRRAYEAGREMEREKQAKAMQTGDYGESESLQSLAVKSMV